jgi:hypothetical protein
MLGDFVKSAADEDEDAGEPFIDPQDDSKSAALLLSKAHLAGAQELRDASIKKETRKGYER